MTQEPETEALERIDTWRQRLSDQTVVSASEVQGRLFDLYGDLEPLPQLEKLKPWISLTIQRELFSATELEAFLAELEEDLSKLEKLEGLETLETLESLEAIEGLDARLDDDHSGPELAGA